MSLIQKLLHLTNFSSPFLRTAVPALGTAYAIQAAFAVPSILTQSERFYDFSGALTNISVVALSLYLPSLRARYAGATTALPSLLKPFTNPAAAALNWRQVTLTAFVTIWAVRCKKPPQPPSSIYLFGPSRLRATRALTSRSQWVHTSSNAYSNKAPTHASRKSKNPRPSSSARGWPKRPGVR